MQSDYKVKKLVVEDDGGIVAICYDVLYGETFEKYLGYPEDFDGRENASMLLQDSTYEMTDEVRNEIMSTFGVEEFLDDQDYEGYQFYDFGDDDFEDDEDEIDELVYTGNGNGISTEDEDDFAVPTRLLKRESFNLREALNQIDLDTYNKYDLLNLYESCNLSENEKRALANIVYDQEDANVIYDTLNKRYVSGEEIGMPERVKDGVIHEESLEKPLSESTFRGVPNTIFIGHGNWSDPEIATEYEGKTYVANYWEIEDSFYQYYLDEKEYAEKHTDKYAQNLKNTYTFDSSDEDFEKFLHNHADEVVSDIIELGKVEDDTNESVEDDLGDDELNAFYKGYTEEDKNENSAYNKLKKNVDDFNSIKEEVEKVYTKKNGDYLVKGDNGGYQAFSKDDVHLGHIDEEDPKEAQFKFDKNQFTEEVNQSELTETTNRELKAKRADLRKRITTRLGTDDTFGTYSQWTDEERKERTELDCISELHSLLTYYPLSDIESIMSDKDFQEYIGELGEQRVRELALQEIEEFANATIHTVSAPGGGNYCGVSFARDKVDESKSIKESDEDTPYTKEEVERDLKSITHNFTDKDGELKCGFVEEKNSAVEILKKHYKVVEPSGDDRREGTWYHISYAEPKNLKESFPTHSGIDLDRVVFRVATILSEEKLGDNWIEFISARESRPHFNGEEIIFVDCYGPTDDDYRRVTLTTNKGDIDVTFRNGSEAKCQDEYEIARFIAGEYGVALKESINESEDKYVIYKENGTYKGTPKSNYGGKTSNARLIQTFDDFESPEEIVDYMKKYSKQKSDDDYEIIDESLLQDLHKDHEHIKKEYGQEVYDAMDEYIELGNDLGDILYRESEWNKFVDWAEKNKGIKIETKDDIVMDDIDESKSNHTNEAYTKLVESMELSNDQAMMSVVDQIKAVYEAGLFDRLPTGRENAATTSIYGPDKERLVGYFKKQPEFNYEMNTDGGIISHEFISDKYDVEIFDEFISIYKIPTTESIDDEPIKITSNSKMKEIDIEDKSEVGADGHPIDRLSNYSAGKLK